MRSLIIAILLLCITSVSQAQNYEVGAFLGGSNYIGEVGPDQYINPNSFAFGVLGRYNISTRYSYRLGLMFSELQADDLDSDNWARQQRGYNFKNRVLELSLGMEFNFLEFDLHNFDRPVTPYIYGGVSYLLHEELYFSSNTATDNGNKSTFAIPMGLGVKAKVGMNWVLGAEIGVRYAFTDNLDGSNPTTQLNNAMKFGNTYSDDWYVFSGVIITYTFGEKPCYHCYE